MSVPLYHGTRAAFRRGGYVLSGDLVGKDNHGLGRSDTVYLTPDRKMAAMWARAAKGRGKPKVVTVRPGGRLEVNDSTVGDEEEEHEGYRCYGWCEVLNVSVVNVMWN